MNELNFFLAALCGFAALREQSLLHQRSTAGQKRSRQDAKSRKGSLTCTDEFSYLLLGGSLRLRGFAGTVFVATTIDGWAKTLPPRS